MWGHWLKMSVMCSSAVQHRLSNELIQRLTHVTGGNNRRLWSESSTVWEKLVSGETTGSSNAWMCTFSCRVRPSVWVWWRYLLQWLIYDTGSRQTAIDLYGFGLCFHLLQNLTNKHKEFEHEHNPKSSWNKNQQLSFLINVSGINGHDLSVNVIENKMYKAPVHLFNYKP